MPGVLLQRSEGQALSRASSSYVASLSNPFGRQRGALWQLLSSSLHRLTLMQLQTPFKKSISQGNLRDRKQFDLVSSRAADWWLENSLVVLHLSAQACAYSIRLQWWCIT